MTWLAFFLSACLSFALSAPQAYRSYVHAKYPVFYLLSHSWERTPPPSFAEAFLGILPANLLVFALYGAIAYRFPYLSLMGLLMLAAKTGAMAAPYGDIVWNVPVYAVVMVLVALVEFGAYAMAPARRYAEGVALLALGALVETYLIATAL